MQQLDLLLSDFLTQPACTADDVIAFLTQFKLLITTLEKQYTRAQILKHLQPLREAARVSPFMQRAQIWPRGYQGDFETIDYMIQAANKAPQATFGYYLEDFFLKSDICKQHINKISVQSQLILEAIRKNSAAKIISIGCGTSADLQNAQAAIKASGATIMLIDVDIDAINYSRQQLTDISERVAFKRGNIYKIMRTLTEQYDLILIGGVFDYLNNKTITAILKSFRHNICQNGKVFFTNIDAGNPYRVFMEYLSNWFLIERSAADLMRLITAANWPDASIVIRKDKTGLTHLAELNYN